jgi:hypothetical protein
MTDAYHGLPTPRTTLRARYVSLLVWCKGGCQHQAHADLQALIDQGKGDVPLTRLKFRQRSDRLRGDVAGQSAAVVTRAAIPIVYQGQQFPSRKALAEHLAPLLGRSVAALKGSLYRHNDNIERVVGGLVQPSSGKAIPIVYQGQQFPNRAALARHLAPLVGKTRSTLITLLSRYDGDVDRAVTPQRRSIAFEGQVFPHRKALEALAEYLAPRLHRPARSVEGLLRCHNDDVEAVLLARPYRQRPRRVRRA